jgi:callose synthase
MYFVPCPRTVEDFDDWTNWLLYKGGVGVKGDSSWESWWDEEQVAIYLCFNYYYVLTWVVCSFHLKLTLFNYISLNMYIQEHIQTFRGRILETILSLRFLIFQYGIVYKLKITDHNTSLAVSCAVSRPKTLRSSIGVLLTNYSSV